MLLLLMLLGRVVKVDVTLAAALHLIIRNNCRTVGSLSARFQGAILTPVW